MRPISDRRRKRDAAYRWSREEVYERAGGRCEVIATTDCTLRAEQVHHIAGRGGPDPHRLDNLLGVCAPCHAYIHAHPEEARTRGWMVSRHTKATP